MTQIGADKRNRHNEIWRAIATGSFAVGMSFGLAGVELSETMAIAQSSAPSPSSSSEASPSNSSANAVPDGGATESSQRPDQPLLQLGSTGSEVLQVQAMLTLLGFYTDPIDGQFGSSTAIAVTQFQTVAGLVADGIVGPSTWSRLLPTPERLAEHSAESVDDEQAQGSSSGYSTFPVPESVTEQRTPEDAPQASINSPEPSSTGEPTRESTPSSSNGDTDNVHASQRLSNDVSPSADESASVELPILRRGMQGSAVVALQERLQVLGLFSGRVDGVFGPQTEAAVVNAQRRLQLNPDGIVGRATWTALLRFE